MKPAQPLKLLLVLPDGRIHKLGFGAWHVSLREAPLTATTLAALIPPDIDARVTIIDESIGMRVPFQQAHDLVGISCLTGTCTRAYAIADRFRAQGVPVVLGGVHVTLRPDEAAQHADAIVIGPAEETWGQLLRDFQARRLQPAYQATRVKLDGLPHARRDLQRRFGYVAPNTIFATRGCKGTCDFCTIPAVKIGWHKRPIAEVIDELRSIRGRRIAFNDVHLTEEPDYAKEFFEAMIPLRKEWGGLASTRILQDDELLELMRQSGCRFLLIGFETLNNRSLAAMHKRFNQVPDYQRLVQKLHALGIVVQGCFIFGLDEDDRSVFATTVEMIDELKIDIPRYAIYTPYPGTALFQRLQAEGRLLHEQWAYYDTQHVVFQPQQMTPGELDEGFKWAYRRTFALRSILKRIGESGRNFYITFIGNLAYKRYVRRLDADAGRFPEKLTPWRGGRAE